jgi:hypothetical protein
MSNVVQIRAPRPRPPALHGTHTVIHVEFRPATPTPGATAVSAMLRLFFPYL